MPVGTHTTHTVTPRRCNDPKGDSFARSYPPAINGGTAVHAYTVVSLWLFGVYGENPVNLSGAREIDKAD